jgi:polysaccharide biosynthesis transport protein
MSDVTITQPADPRTAIVKPNWGLNHGVAIFIGLLLAATTVLVVEYLDSRIRTRADIEQDLSLPVLALIPKLDASAAKGTDENGHSEAFLELATQLRYASETPYRSIAITSPNKGDGKSTIATNLAIALGEMASGQSDAIGTPRVLLVDADLRRPSLHRQLSLHNDVGLSDILVGRTRFDEAVQHTAHPGVDVLTSGTASRNPIKLLQSETFDRVLELAKERYATVILDAPATLPVIDAAILGAKANATIMVVSSGTTDLKATKRALQRLHSVGVRDFVGVVLNRAKRPVGEDYSDYFAIPVGASPRTAELNPGWDAGTPSAGGAPA